MQADSPEEWIKILRNKGYKATPQRLAIITEVKKDRTHPSALKIYERVKKLHPMISLGAVYNTLKIMRELREVIKLDFSNEIKRYESNMLPHINLVCTNCGK